MAPGGGHHHGPAGHILSQHIGKVGAGVRAAVRHKGDGLGGRDERLAFQRLHHLGDRLGGVNAHPGAAAGLGGLRSIVGGQIEGLHPGLGGGQGHGQHPGHGPQGTVQGHLPQKGGAGGGDTDLA